MIGYNKKTIRFFANCIDSYRFLSIFLSGMLYHVFATYFFTQSTFVFKLYLANKPVLYKLHEQRKETPIVSQFVQTDHNNDDRQILPLSANLLFSCFQPVTHFKLFIFLSLPKFFAFLLLTVFIFLTSIAFVYPVSSSHIFITNNYVINDRYTSAVINRGKIKTIE